MFHHGLIKILLVHQLKLQNDDWNAFLTRNGFVTSNTVEVDKPMMEETLVPATDRAVPTSTEACVTTTLSEPIPDQKDVEPTTLELHSHEQHAYPNASAKNTNRPSYKLSKGDMDIGFKNKRQVG